MYREPVQDSVVKTAISLLKESGANGAFGTQIRRLQPTVSAQNIVSEVTRLGHNIIATNLKVDIVYVYAGLYED